MTDKEYVLQIYPDAILVHDVYEANRKKNEGYVFRIAREIPQSLHNLITNDVLILNSPFIRFSTGFKPEGIGDWATTEENAWKVAWEHIQDEMIQKLKE
jgi:hypothetical protein